MSKIQTAVKEFTASINDNEECVAHIQEAGNALDEITDEIDDDNLQDALDLLENAVSDLVAARNYLQDQIKGS